MENYLGINYTTNEDGVKLSEKKIEFPERNAYESGILQANRRVKLRSQDDYDMLTIIKSISRNILGRKNLTYLG